MLIGTKKLSLSESFNDLHFVKHSRGGLAWDVVSPPRQNSPNRSLDVPNPCDKSILELVNKNYSYSIYIYILINNFFFFFC